MGLVIVWPMIMWAKWAKEVAAEQVIVDSIALHYI